MPLDTVSQKRCLILQGSVERCLRCGGIFNLWVLQIYCCVSWWNHFETRNSKRPQVTAKPAGQLYPPLHRLGWNLAHHRKLVACFFLFHIDRYILSLWSEKLVLLQPPNFCRHGSGLLLSKQNHHCGVLQCSWLSYWALIPENCLSLFRRAVIVI